MWEIIRGSFLSSTYLLVANFVSGHTPLTRAFGFRRKLFVLAGARIAQSAKLCAGVAMVGANVEVGADTWVGARTTMISTIHSAVVIGARCDIAPDVLFVVGSHDLGNAERRGGRGTSRSISVGAGSWIGARSTFIAGAAVGRGCVVAAGSVVTKVFPENVLIGGVPASVIRNLESTSDGRSA